MAPTELLAEQHYRVFKQWLEPLGVRTVFLSGQLKAKERREVLSALANGQAQVALGTHALFQKEVLFSKLALIVVDEQHRFGVHQRALLREKGLSEQTVPHQLIMTATPIPRTLAMSMYADLDCSIMDELPQGRLPIQTRVLSNQRREEVLMHVRQACQAGRQAYWVCPLIEESEILECQAAEKTAQAFQKSLPELKIGLVHGRMKSAEKEQIMQAFKAEKIHLLVATTVIEVGVDVPNASLMVIENAERLGLSQLHQLRGRVGRGKVESHCLLLYQNPLSELAGKRLAAIRSTQDGFKVAEQDLQLRGPGDILGTRQTGDIAFKIAELMRDSGLLPLVIEAASELMLSYPEQVDPLVQRWLCKRQQLSQV
jgi:ATP-dependent DNA helicase RecG